MTMTVNTPKVVVPIKSAWLSKINWAQAISTVAMAGTTFGLFDLDADTQVKILSGIIGIQSAVTWVLKTFFTNTVTSSSVPPGTGMRE